MIIIEEYEGDDMAQNTTRCTCTGCQQMRLLAVFVLLEEMEDLTVRWDARVLLRLWERRLAEGVVPLDAEVSAVESNALERCTSWVYRNRSKVRMLAPVVGWSGGAVN